MSGFEVLGYFNYFDSVRMKYVLTIAGSDSSGGAGIQADIRTITFLKAHAQVALTAITAQNSLGVDAIYEVPAQLISRQIETVIDDQFPHAVKIGMVFTGDAVMEIARMIKKHDIERLVVDPVIKASSGVNLLEPHAIPLLRERLLPLAHLVTPNLDEAGILTDRSVRNLEQMEEAAKDIKELGPNVVITGGHLEERCVDLLYDGKEFHRFSGSRIETADTHGSGCVFSSSLATFLAMDYGVKEATRLAHDFTRNAIINGYQCGRGPGVVSPGPRVKDNG